MKRGHKDLSRVKDLLFGSDKERRCEVRMRAKDMFMPEHVCIQFNTSGNFSIKSKKFFVTEI